MATIRRFDLAGAALEGEGVRIEDTGEGTARIWVGPSGGMLRFAGPVLTKEYWPTKGMVSVEVYHELPLTLPVRFAFGEREDEPAVIQANAGVLPRVRTRVMFPLSALKGETVFVPRTPGRLKMVVGGRPSHPDAIIWVGVGIGVIGEGGWVEFSDLQLLDDLEVVAPEGEPVVDELGQWTAKTWPGKTHSEEELRERLLAVKAEPETPVPGRTTYGGSSEIWFEATGFFRTQHDGKRWWLVDPEGGAFWSAGVDCVRPEMECFVEGNESLCAFLPPGEGEFADAWSGESRFNWSIANLIRVFGRGWREAWEALARKALVNWGFNTVANWSEGGFARRSRLPYVLPLANFPTTEHTVFRDFPDVFSPDYTRAAQQFAEQLVAYRDDPYLIGYFLRNEPLWGFGQFRIAEELLCHEAHRAPGCRQVLAQTLALKYRGSAERFCQEWGGAVGTFDELEQVVLPSADWLTDRARRDLSEFSRRMVERYVRVPSEACRLVDPQHLNLGMRWAWIASEDLLAGSDAFDVFSLNMYQMAPDRAMIERASKASGKPVMIGEYHWGARDVGLPSTGLRAVASQADRGKAYRYYVEQGAAIPELVGAHYFQMNDQPVLGRFDGENFQIGLVDICWRPYEAMVAAARETHERLYEVAAGKVKPFAEEPEELVRVGF